jgi:hypothetical protein
MSELAPIPAGQRFRMGDLKRTGDRLVISLPVLMGFNLGSRTISVSLSMEKFRELSEVANEARIIEMSGEKGLIAQRPLDEKHARSIGLYILRGLLFSLKERWELAGEEIPDELHELLLELGAGPYQGLQPITGNIRECEPGGDDLEVERTESGRLILHLRQGQLIWVIDGQHRRYGYGLLIEWLREITSRGQYVRKSAIFLPAEREDFEFDTVEAKIWAGVLEEAKVRCTVDVSVHLGLDASQERQLFHDLNNLGKKPDAAIAQAFDQANPVSIFVRKEIETNDLLGTEVKIADAGSKRGQRRGRPDFVDQTIYRDDLVVCNALLFAGAWNPAGIIASKVNPHYAYASRFWSAIARQPNFGTPGWYQATLLAQPVMLKALAQLAFTFHASREADAGNLERFMSALEDHEIDFSPDNDLWAAYLVPVDERVTRYPGIERYMTPVIAMQPYGLQDPETGVLRFGSSSRDIARYIGDLIRWKLGLPPRPALVSLVTRLINEERLPPEALAQYQPALVEDLEEAAADHHIMIDGGHRLDALKEALDLP